MKLSGKILEVFVLDKEYKGLQAIDLKNWSGRAFIGYREFLAKIKNHEGLRGPSVYFLLSSEQDEESGNFKVYVGETEEFYKRIVQHQEKIWWDKFICFAGVENTLTKAHVLYLEKKFHIAFSSNDIPVEVKNDQSPPGAKLSNSDECYLEGYIENIYFILRTMGFDYFEPDIVRSIENDFAFHNYRDYSILNGKRFKIKIPTFSKFAFMRVEKGKCILEKGSFVCSVSKPSFTQSSYYKKWERMLRTNKFSKSEDQGLLVLNSEIEADSPSHAAALVWAARVNGPKHWKCAASGKSFKDLQIEIYERAA